MSLDANKRVLTQNYRVILEHDLLSSAEGLAGDEALVSGLSAGASPPTLRLYRYQPCAIVGRYQNLTDAIDLERCRAGRVAWNRRHTGGGTVLMGPEQVAIALAAPDGQNAQRRTIRQHFEFFASILSDALDEFGIKSSFVGKNDLQVEGRKIAGLAISQDTDGVVFYHGSLLLDFDVSLMVEILHLPTERLDDRGQSCFSQRMTTAREYAPDVSFSSMTAAIVRTFSQRVAAEMCEAPWLPHELETIASLKRERYENDTWIYSSRVMRRWRGMAEGKTPAGTIRVYVDGSGTALDAVLITGDYFSRNLDLASLEASLKGTPARVESVLDVIRHYGREAIYRLDAEVLAEMIVSARESGNRPVRLSDQT